jgi:hypothetical protein
MRTRRQLGLPEQGELGSDSSIAVEPAQYQLRDNSESSVTVLLLGYLTTTTPTQGSQTRIGLFPADMRWNGSDWRLAQGASTDYSQLRVQPGTSQAAAAGWLDYTR